MREQMDREWMDLDIPALDGMTRARRRAIAGCGRG